MKIRPLGAQLLHVDREMDMTEANRRFSKFRERA